ncbi:MAG: ABC transporter ATP-binding protein [Gallionella sp.]|nr:ABC transporter ATP-binding protein [Gallionella sp.]
MSQPALRVEALGKAYRQYKSQWRRVFSWFGLPVKPVAEHWVLRDASFTLSAGETVGIIGQNGAGKSTLLKLITGTQRPSEGRVQVNGRIAAILELGMGFNTEFTGRQNAYHGLGMMGFSHAEIEQAMHGVESFAEIGEYFDQPVRIYSSGMQVRVAFAVATAFRPEILIVDEALSVGDIFFQQKCFERIRAYSEAGTTLLFVSHALSTVYSLCDRAILLNAGRIVLDGSPREVIDLYNAQVLHQRNGQPEQVSIVESRPPAKPDEGNVREAQAGSGGGQEGSAIGSFGRPGVAIRAVDLCVEGHPVDAMISESEATVRVRVAFAEECQDPHIGFQIRNVRGEPVFMTNTYCMRHSIGAVRGGEEVVAEFTFKAGLAAGDYTITAGVAEDGAGEGDFRQTLARTQDAKAFMVLKNMDTIVWSGVVNLDPQCQIRRV